jgi:uncharacterized membrane protein
VALPYVRLSRAVAVRDMQAQHPMRSVQVQVRTERLDPVLSLATQHGARSPVAVPVRRAPARAGPVQDSATAGGDGWSLVFITLPNDRVGAFVDAVSHEVHDAEFILLPVGALPLATPLDRLDERVRDVSRLSTLELVVASLQSVGAWRGMLLFSLLAGAIGAYGLIFDVSYLLVAAMLVNPMGAPALVSVVGLAIGDGRMFARGGARFAVSLAVQAVTALALGFGYGLSVSTAMMEQVASLSTWAVLVALAAGAAGAQTQVKSERDSLVSGTAAGFMVAAALAPPAAVLGLSVPLGRWDYFGLMAFLLLLQFLAIAIGGWVVLHLLGVRPSDPSTGRGAVRSRNMLVACVLAATVALVAWQAQREPRFNKADLSRTALEIARDAVDQVPGAFLLESSARFTRPELDRYDREGMLLEIMVERGADAPDDDALAAGIRERVRDLVRARMDGVVVFIHVTALPGPPASSR